jgi:indolepyruvate ferredoxin oxidoreductase alpha subunit
MMIDMGAGIGMGLDLRHVLPEAEARKVVSVIGDSTFLHSGITGLLEAAYNPPPTGHVVVILDNGTTAMTGQQEHPGTGRKLNSDFTNRVSYEALGRAAGFPNVLTINPIRERDVFKDAVQKSLAKNELTLIIAKSPCILAVSHIVAGEKERKVWESNGISGGVKTEGKVL